MDSRLGAIKLKKGTTQKKWGQEACAQPNTYESEWD